jgi:tRNA-dihydrouridine synthase B
MTTALSTYLNRPLSIGGRSVSPRLVMAPMTFLGHIAFRELVSEFGGYGLLWTEMCSARRIPRENRHISPYFSWRDEELPHLVCQIFGNDPGTMADAARRIASEGFFGVDINFGCSVAQICRQNCGAALLKTPALAASIVARVRKAVSIPLFVKFRTGWQDDPDRAVEMARRFEDAGADALVFHPRVSPDRRSRLPRWSYIGRIKSAVGIPVFGNGNVFTAGNCLEMIETTGCDGVALGRIAIAMPWVFSQWTEERVFGPEVYLNSAMRLKRLMAARFSPDRALRRYKKFALYFAANFRFGHTLHSKILGVKNMAAIDAVLADFFRHPPETGSRPNMNFFN